MKLIVIELERLRLRKKDLEETLSMMVIFKYLEDWYKRGNRFSMSDQLLTIYWILERKCILTKLSEDRLRCPVS